MRYTLILMLALFATIASAQDNALFKVIAYSDGPTINTDKGDVFKLTSSVKAGIVGPFKRREALNSMGSIHYDRIGITLTSVRRNTNTSIVRDSLFISWIPDDPLVAEATVFLKNTYDQLIDKWTAKNNYAVIPLPFNKSNTLIFQVEGLYELRGKKKPRTLQSEVLAFKRPGENDKAALDFDLARLEATPDKILMESAIYRMHNFLHDSNWGIYKTWKSKVTTTDPVLSAYYHWMLDQFRIGTL